MRQFDNKFIYRNELIYMLNTSHGYHTISMFQKLTAEEHSDLRADFRRLIAKNEIEGFPIKNEKNGEIGWVYSCKNNKGITWITLSFDVNHGHTVYGVKAVINPKVLLNKDYIRVANERDVKSFTVLFNAEARRISIILGNIDLYSMSRCDYCINFDLKELRLPCTSEQMMALIKRGNIPKRFNELFMYDRISHRQKSDKDSFYLESDSVTINCYNKYAQLKKEENHPCPNKEDAKSIIRFEIQYKNRKLYSLSKSNKRILSNPPELLAERELDELYDDLISNRRVAIPIEAILSDNIAACELEKYFYKVIQRGDYYTLEAAKRLIEEENWQQKKKERLIGALTLVSQCRSIYKAKSTLDGKDLDGFRKSLRDLSMIGINPVTIPREWNIEFIPNLLKAYYNELAVIHEKEFLEQNKREILEDYFKDCRKLGKSP